MQNPVKPCSPEIAITPPQIYVTQCRSYNTAKKLWQSYRAPHPLEQTAGINAPEAGPNAKELLGHILDTEALMTLIELQRKLHTPSPKGEPSLFDCHLLAITQALLTYRTQTKPNTTTSPVTTNVPEPLREHAESFLNHVLQRSSEPQPHPQIELISNTLHILREHDLIHRRKGENLIQQIARVMQSHDRRTTDPTKTNGQNSLQSEASQNELINIILHTLTNWFIAERITAQPSLCHDCVLLQKCARRLAPQ